MLGRAIDRNTPGFEDPFERRYIADWVSEIVTCFEDAKYFLAAAMVAEDRGAFVTLEDGEEMYPDGAQEHERFCNAALECVQIALNKVGQLANTWLDLGKSEDKVDLKTLCRNERCEASGLSSIIRPWLEDTRVKQAMEVRRRVVHRRNPTGEIRGQYRDGYLRLWWDKETHLDPHDLARIVHDFVQAFAELFLLILRILPGA